MIVHTSKAKNEGWIDTRQSLPEPDVKVKTACITILDWNIEQTIWETIGSIRKDGIWRILASESATKRKVFDYKITHWKPI